MREAVVNGTLLPDGTLQLNQPVPLPPGPVEISVRASPRSGESTLQVLQEIWAESQREGFTARSADEIDRELRQLRDEAETRQRSVEAVQAGDQTD